MGHMGLKSFIDALPAIANALGDSFGVEVVIGNYSAHTNGKAVYLPMLSADNPKAKVLGLGYTVHESAHVRYSDFRLAFSTPLEKHVSGILEDVRIEKAISEEFPGTAKMLSDLAEEMIAVGFFSKPEEKSSPTQIMLSHLMYGLRHDVLKQKPFAEYAELTSKIASQNLPNGMFTKLNALMYQIVNCTSESEVQKLAQSIITMMEEEAKKEEEKAKKEKSQEQQENNDQTAQQPQSQPGKSDDQDQDQSPQGESQQGSGQGQQSSEGAQDSDGGQNQGDDQQSGSVGQGAGASDAAANAELINSILGAGDEDWNDMGNAVAGMLNDQADPSQPSAATPYKPRMVSPVTEGDTSAAKARTACATNGLRHKMQTILQARTFAVKRSTSFGTKLNFKTLHRAPLMGPVFEKIKEGKAVDTAISLLIDISGSMSGKEMLAMDAALATMQAFQRPNVATAAFAFPNPEYSNSNAVLKMWHEQPAASILRSMKMHANGGTPMAEAMFGAGIDLCKRREKRKILFVVTDGDPNHYGQASWVIDTARKTGIEVLGLGIHHNVDRLFGVENSTRIDSIDELPKSMIGLLEQFV